MAVVHVYTTSQQASPLQVVLLVVVVIAVVLAARWLWRHRSPR